jgi:hypothetical protein
MLTKTLLFFLLILNLPIYAQDQESKFKAGFKGGFNISSFTKDIDLMDQPEPLYSSFKKSSRGSALIGITLDYELSKHLLLGSELLFNTRGMGYKDENTEISVTIDQGQQKKSNNYLKYNLDYLELPIIVNYNFLPEKSKSMLFGYVGIAPSILINHKRRLKYDVKEVGESDQKQNLPYTKSFLNNIVAGVKLLEKESLGLESYIDLRGNYSLSNVFNQTLNTAGKNFETRMYTFTLALGIRIL